MCIYGIFVFDEVEVVYEFDFSNVIGVMGGEVSFDIGFGSCYG